MAGLSSEHSASIGMEVNIPVKEVMLMNLRVAFKSVTAHWIVGSRIVVLGTLIA